MFLQRLSLFNFKNHAQSEFQFDKKISVFVGLNGVGKTNILDAIYFLSTTKSSFNNLDAQLIKHGENFFRLESDYNNALSLVCKYQKGKKVMLKNEIEYEKLSEHFGTIPVVIASPDDVLLIIEGSEERRRFIDYTLSTIDKTYLKHLRFYNQALEQRNMLLKRADNGLVDRELLMIYNHQLDENSIPIHAARKKFIDELQLVFADFYAAIAEDKEQVRLEFQSDLNHKKLDQLLMDSFAKDMALQRTTVGIHKDDLLFLTNSYTTKKFGSQGQQKTFLYALRMAQFEIIRRSLNTKPLLLIDDLFDKLDGNRGKNLLYLLQNDNRFGQIFITETNRLRVEESFENKEQIEIFEI